MPAFILAGGWKHFGAMVASTYSFRTIAKFTCPKTELRPKGIGEFYW